jgi:hypothetical protein
VATAISRRGSDEEQLRGWPGLKSSKQSALWDRPWKELLCARGSGARETALFFGRHYGRLNLKELGQLAGGIHHNAVSIAIRRFTERLKSDSMLLAKFSLVQKALELC